MKTISKAKGLWTMTLFMILGCEGAELDASLSAGDGYSTQEQAWDTGVSPDSPNGSHQWLFARGLVLLSKHTDLPGVSEKLAWLNAPGCLKQARQGLFDADFLAKYSGAKKDLTAQASTIDYLLAGATYAAHFYDPDTGTTYNGELSPTANAMVNSLLTNSRNVNIQGQSAFACHELGVAAHFFGDLSNPMHTALFTSKNMPLFLHSNLEFYTMGIQDHYAITDWSQAPRGDVEGLMLETASRSKALWSDTFAAVQDTSRARNCWTKLRPKDNPECWQNAPAVDGLIGESLKLAQDSMARFLYLTDLGLGLGHGAQGQ